MKMKKLPIILACTLLMLVLVPSLHAAQQPAPAAPVDLAQIFAPASSAVTATPADLATPAATNPFMASLNVVGCSATVCISECSDCPFGYYGYCISTATCRCGCRH
jgi:hypothetical protein